MAVTFTNEPLGSNFRHTVKTERGYYVMGKSWIDTTSPRDMMDYDFTNSYQGGVIAANETHANWCAQQTGCHHG